MTRPRAKTHPQHAYLVVSTEANCHPYHPRSPRAEARPTPKKLQVSGRSVSNCVFPDNSATRKHCVPAISRAWEGRALGKLNMGNTRAAPALHSRVGCGPAHSILHLLATPLVRPDFSHLTAEQLVKNTQVQANCSQVQPCDSLCQTSHLFPQEGEGRVAMETPQGKGRA